MEAFYSRVCQLFSSVIDKNEAIIIEIEEIKTKCSEMLEQLGKQNDAIIDEVNLFEQNATKEFKIICDDLVSKSTFNSLEQRANDAEHAANQMLDQQTKYLKQIEDLEFELKNMKSVSLLSQKDKYNRTLQIEIENLEKKLKASEAKYKNLEDRIYLPPTAATEMTEAPAMATSQPQVLVSPKTKTPTKRAVSPIQPKLGSSTSSPTHDTISCQLLRCYARIGNDKIAPATLTTDEISAYPPDVYKSKTGKFIGHPCANQVSISGAIFCAEHSTGFNDIRVEPPTNGDKKKKKGAVLVPIETNDTATMPVVANSVEPNVSVLENTTLIQENAQVLEVVEQVKEKKTRKKKTIVDEQSAVVSATVALSTNPVVEVNNAAQSDEKVKKPRKKKNTDETEMNENQTPTSQTSTPETTGAKRGRKKKETTATTTPQQQQEIVLSPASQASTPGSTGSKRGRKKKEQPPSPVRTPIVQQQKEHSLVPVSDAANKIRPNKPDWAFVEPWDAPDGTQYVVDTKNNYVFEATDSGDIGAFTGFMRV
jgi:hypothetical protein